MYNAKLNMLKWTIILFVQRWLEDNLFVTQFARSKDQVADIHTKELTKQGFHEFRRKLGVIVPPFTSLRGSVEES